MSGMICSPLNIPLNIGFDILIVLFAVSMLFCWFLLLGCIIRHLLDELNRVWFPPPREGNKQDGAKK